MKWAKFLEKEKEQLIDEVVTLCWYMRGSLQWERAMRLSYLERKRAFDFINKRLEKLKDADFPVY